MRGRGLCGNICDGDAGSVCGGPGSGLFRGDGLRVDVVDADEVILNEDLTFFGIGNW